MNTTDLKPGMRIKLLSGNIDTVVRTYKLNQNEWEILLQNYGPMNVKWHWEWELA